MEVFYSVAETATIVEMWRQSYNQERPHSSLSYQTSAEFAATWRLVAIGLQDVLGWEQNRSRLRVLSARSDADADRSR
jgi:hypothetical protein